MRSIENEELVENTECGKWGLGWEKNKKKNHIKTYKSLVIRSAMLFES